MVCSKTASETKGPTRTDLGSRDLGVWRTRKHLLGVLVEAVDKVRQQDLGVVEQPCGHRRVLAAQIVEVQDEPPLAALGHPGHLLLGQRVPQVLLEAVLVALRVRLQPRDRRHCRRIAAFAAAEAAHATKPAATALPKERPAKHPVHLSVGFFSPVRSRKGRRRDGKKTKREN